MPSCEGCDKRAWRGRLSSACAMTPLRASFFCAISGVAMPYTTQHVSRESQPTARQPVQYRLAECDTYQAKSRHAADAHSWVCLTLHVC